jgi:hypothetical protein
LMIAAQRQALGRLHEAARTLGVFVEIHVLRPLRPHPLCRGMRSMMPCRPSSRLQDAGPR